MDIELTETKTYSFKLGDKLLSGFTIASEWNGMTELRCGMEKVVVYGLVAGASNGIAGAFGDIFGGARKSGEPCRCRIISASSGIAKMIAAAQQHMPAEE